VPYQLTQQEVEVRATAATVEIFHGGLRVSSHARSHVPHVATTVADHRPKSHQRHLEWTPSRLVDCAEFEIFGSIRSQLREREGCMVDAENSPVAVSAAFKSWGIDHGCYGNGNKFQNPVTSPNLRPSPVDICDVCELAPAVLDMIDTYQSIFKDYPSVFHRLSGSGAESSIFSRRAGRPRSSLTETRPGRHIIRMPPWV
jgi:hypothetical protein